MALHVNEIQQQIREQTKAPAIKLARFQQERLQFHVQPAMQAAEMPYLSTFLAFVKNLIPADKFKDFKDLLRVPLKTNELTGECFDKLARIFEGQNPSYSYQFADAGQAQDWEVYRREVLHEPTVWATKGWDMFKTEINSVLVVDMPANADPGEYPRPYFYWLPIKAVISYDLDAHTGTMRWIIFHQPGGRIAVIDDELYRIFETKGNTLGALVHEQPHGLGYCPARFFWQTPISTERPDVKLSPLTKVLEKLDWLLYFETAKEYLDTYASYPIYSGYEQQCDFSNETSTCVGGFLKDRQGKYEYDAAGLPLRCPKCGDKRIVGPGSFIEIPIPSTAEGVPDLRNPVQILSIDRQSLDYNVQELQRLKAEIVAAVVGAAEDTITRAALNEDQIASNLESQNIILHRIKKGFEDARKFVDDTVCRLRYGGEFIGSNINMGTEFFLLSPDQMRKRYTIAQQNGASEAELDALHEQILKSEYRNDPTQLQRMRILSDLEPYRHLSRAEMLDLFKQNIIDADTLDIKLQFANFVRRFERENTNVLDFGSALPYDKKIEIIYNTFKTYARKND